MPKELTLFRLKEAPQVWQPRSLYFIKPDDADYAECYITGNDAEPVGIANTEAVTEIVGEITIDIGNYDPGDLTQYFLNGLAGE